MDRQTFSRLLKALGIRLTVEQWEILSDQHRYKLIAGGVRAGKSHTAALFLVLKIVQSIYDGTAKPGDRYWLVGQSYDKAKEEYRYVIRFLQKLQLYGDHLRTWWPGRITLGVCPCAAADCSHERITITTHSALNEESLASEAPRGIVICEAAQISLEAFWKCEERVLETNGWILLAGTFEGSLGWYPERFKWWESPASQAEDDAKSFSLPTWSNLVKFPGGRNDPAILKFIKGKTDEWIDERLAGKPHPPRGRVFKAFQNHIHVKAIEYQQGFPVYIWVDPGYSRATESAYAVEFAQLIGGQFQVFDEIYEQELFGRQICDIAKKRPWWDRATDKYGAIDIAGKAHMAMPSQVEVWLDETGVWLEPTGIDILGGIERMHSLLVPDPSKGNQPGIVFSPKCQGAISEFGGGMNPFNGQVKVYEWQMDRAGGVVGMKPRDRYNHAIKAITYGITAHFGIATEIPGGERLLSPGRAVEVSYW